MKINEKDGLGNRMKMYEAEYNSVISRDKYFVIRLDGHNFSKFTKIFNYPYDELFRNAMVMTCQQLMNEFNAVFAYTQSDEITLGFIPCAENEERVYAGKVQKLISLTSSFASMNLYKNLITSCNDYMLCKLYNTSCWFDARIFTLPNKSEFMNNLIWRQRDCERNSKLMLGYTYFSPKQLLNLSADEVVSKVLVEKRVNWYNQPDSFKYGTLIKKMQKSDNAINCHLLSSKYINISTRVGYDNNTVELLSSKRVEGNKPYEYEIIYHNDNNIISAAYNGTLDINYDKFKIIGKYRNILEIRLTNNLNVVSEYDNNNMLEVKTQIKNKNSGCTNPFCCNYKTFKHSSNYDAMVIKTFNYGKSSDVDTCINEYVMNLNEQYDIINVDSYISIWRKIKE